jgi:hypothetical protein
MMSLNIESKKIKNPFPGLRPFETDEYGLFFGREGQASALISRLERSHFLAIVGTSGSGKSSLVRAGLLPALRGGLMAGAGSGWRIAIMRPGSDPIGNLAAALADKGVLSEAGGGLAPAEALAVIEATLRRGSLGLVDAARQARLAEHDKLLVVVDQFEELFRFRAARPASSSGDDASAFVKLLLEAAQQRELQIYIVPTMRSDFLGDCAQFQGLPEAINDGQYLIPRMTRDERRIAITGPVGVTRGKISEPLVNRLMNDVGDNPDQLPILQHALMRTWDYWAGHRRNGEPLGLEHYEAVGTMSDALSRHADEAFNELPNERSRLIAEKLFKALTERGADNREIRRPTCLKDICSIAEATAAEVIAVVDVFRGGGRSFLMPPAGVHLEPDTVIDISHESLIRNWLRLKDWVNEEAQSARIYRRLAEAAVLHREGSEGLLQDPGLQIALDWRQKANPNAAWARRYHPEFDEALRYLDDSRAARDAAVAERERQREEQIARERRELEQAQLYAEQQHRAARRLRWLSVGMAVMFILALATAAVAMVTWRAAARDRDAASQARDAQAAARIETEESLAKLELTQAELVKKTDIAEASVDQANKANEAAVIERKKAETEAQRANEQARIAEDEKVKAQAEEQRAEAEARKNLKARIANEQFREGVTLAQRGGSENLLNSQDSLEQAVKGYKDADVKNDEAVADANIQLGNLSYAFAYDAFLKAPAGDFGKFATGGIVEKVTESMKRYDEAARIYADPKLNSPEKAAGALFTLGNMLLKFASDKPDGGGAVGGPFGSQSLDVEVPDFNIITGRGSNRQSTWTMSSDQNPQPKYKREAVVRFGRAFDYYRQAFEYNRSRGDEARAKAAREGMKKATYQAGRFFQKELKDDRFLAEPEQLNTYRRQAVQYFEQLLSLYETNDAQVARLLVWLGGLHYELGEQQAAERYFERAIKAYEKGEPSKYLRLDSLNVIAWNAWQAGQDKAALYLYELTLEEYARFESESPKLAATNLLDKAHVLNTMGQIYQAQPGNDSLNKAVGYYRRAVEAYQRGYEHGQGAAHPVEDLLNIGEVAKEINDLPLALQAFRLAGAYTTASRFRKSHKPQEANAYDEIGSVYLLLDQTPEAVDAYEKAAALYREISASIIITPQQREEDTAKKNAADANLARIERVIAAIKAPPPPKQ